MSDFKGGEVLFLYTLLGQGCFPRPKQKDAGQSPVKGTVGMLLIRTKRSTVVQTFRRLGSMKFRSSTEEPVPISENSPCN